MTSIIVEGTVVMEPEFSHESHGEKFYKTCVGCFRTSGASDFIPVIVAETFVKDFEVLKDVRFYGEVRSRNEEGHLNLYVFPMGVALELTGQHQNQVNIDGFICKKPVYRETPLSREITDVLLASNREKVFRSDYIPCICWGRNAVRVGLYEVGTRLVCTGRFQSRTYQKKIDGSVVDMTAYEISLSDARLE